MDIQGCSKNIDVEYNENMDEEEQVEEYLINERDRKGTNKCAKVHIAMNGLLLDDISKEDVMSMKFDPVDDADSFYDMYSRRVGFSVRRDEKKCDKEDIEYNHPFTLQEHVPFLRSHRRVKGDIAQARTMHGIGIKITQITKLFVLQSGRYANVQFLIKDFYNCIDKERKKMEKCHTGTSIPIPYPGPWRVEFGSMNFILEGMGPGLGPSFTIRHRSIYILGKYECLDKTWVVKMNRISGTFKCSCMKLESKGMPYAHMFRVTVLEHTTIIPESCISKKWTPSSDQLNVAHGISPEVSQMACFDMLNVLCGQICYYDYQFEKGTAMLRKTIIRETDKMKALCISKGGQDKNYMSAGRARVEVEYPDMTRAKEDRKCDGSSKKKKHARYGNYGGTDGHNTRTCKQVGKQSESLETDLYTNNTVSVDCELSLNWTQVHDTSDYNQPHMN
ncbi:hypothetical protein M9H77_18289 [Catharanthus roseus]|uniref:Uncharacterized protein n=1 Tax=Catharanthus roseus TaxID=4058 RepID=A0ACC0B716_CATRO|nr:hypothetical protein M9H77_18289 [Catharanthus roseus]